MNARRAGRRVAAAALVLVVAALAGRLPTGWILVEPGAAVPVRAQAAGTGDVGLAGTGEREPAGPREPRGEYLLVTVAARPARVADWLPALLQRERALWPGRVLGTGEPGEIAREQRQALASSQREAVTAAARLLGLRRVPDVRFRLPEGFGGASGGLVFALAAVDALSPGDLSAGLRVAATGTVAADGAVGPVAGVPLKRVAAARAGADVLFVPREGATAGPDAAVSRGGEARLPPVVAVSDLREAVRWLCQRGGRAPACQDF